MAVANAFATGRSPDRAVVCVTTGILQTLDAEELEAVLAHELSHVAHRDVLVMTVASSAGIAAGLLMRFAQFGGMGRSRNNNSALPAVLVALARQPRRLRRQLPAAAPALALPRALRRPGGRLPDAEAGRPRLGAAEDQRRGRPPPRSATCARANAASALCIVPALRGGLSGLMATHPPLQQRLEQLARIQAELSRPTG